MRTVAAILVILYAHLHADDAQNLKNLVPNIAKKITSKVDSVVPNVSDIATSNIIGDAASSVARKIIPDCFFGVESVSMLMFTKDIPNGKKVEVEDMHNIDSSKGIFFLVHGFISSANNTNNYELASTLIEEGCTVFSLDWSPAACTNGLPIVNLAGYPSAVSNTREIGQHLANYVISLTEKTNIPLKNITLIGHSLGAHVCGFAAKRISELGHGKLSRLIAVDPARPLFLMNDCEDRLCVSDAEHVIALHTSDLGMPYSIGDLDFFFNNAHMQPGCTVDISCSHSRGTLYLSEIFRHKKLCKFPGVPIFSDFFSNLGRLVSRPPPYPDVNTTDCMVMNDEILSTSKLIKGTYYTFVESEPPYCTDRVFNCH